MTRTSGRTHEPMGASNFAHDRIDADDGQVLRQPGYVGVAVLRRERRDSVAQPIHDGIEDIGAPDANLLRSDLALAGPLSGCAGYIGQQGPADEIPRVNGATRAIPEHD
jgi:hypothetical protein